MNNFKVFYPFVLYGLLQLLSVIAIAYFAYPPFSFVLVPLFERLLEEQALHYPNNFILLNPLFEWTNIILSGFFGIVAVGLGTLIFASHFQNKSIRFTKSISIICLKYFRLFGVWTVETLVLLVVLIGLPSLIYFLANPYSKIIQIANWTIPFLAILVGAIFAYTTAVILIENHNMLNAIKRSVAIFIEHPIKTFVLIGIPAALLLPLDMLKSQTTLFVTKFFPEVILVLIVIGILLSVLTNCWMVGTVTRLYLAHTRRP